MDNYGEMLIYQTEDGLTKIDVNMQDETVWLTQEQMAELFQRDKSTISRHIRNIFAEGELDEKVVVAEFATTSQHGAMEGKTQSNITRFFNLDVVISVGYRVKSQRGVQFRIWAASILKEYIKKGFAMDDERLKELGGGGYFKELLARIRDIRASEKVFYRQVLEIYATSIDYDPKAEVSIQFFKRVQNSLCRFRRNSGRGDFPSCGCRKGLHGIDVIFGRTANTERSENCKKLFGRKRTAGYGAAGFWLFGFCGKTGGTGNSYDNGRLGKAS